MIARVHITNKDGNHPRSSAHWIAGKDIEDILRIVKKYNINKPVGRKLVNAEFEVQFINQFMEYYSKIRPRSFNLASVWREEKGELKSQKVCDYFLNEITSTAK